MPFYHDRCSLCNNPFKSLKHITENAGVDLMEDQPRLKLVCGIIDYYLFFSGDGVICFIKCGVNITSFLAMRIILVPGQWVTKLQQEK